jgi:hypothetical protein
VAPSGYYRWRRGDPSQRQREDAAIAAQIVVAHEASRGTYPHEILNVVRGFSESAVLGCG